MRNNNKIINTIRNSRGRFFGLYTKQGEALNAQYVDESPSYITVYDRNQGDYRKFSKKSLSGLNFQGTLIGKSYR